MPNEIPRIPRASAPDTEVWMLVDDPYEQDLPAAPLPIAGATVEINTGGYTRLIMEFPPS